VTLSGHIDTVHPKGMFGYPAVKRDGDKIYGPGVTDCKGGIVAGFFAMEALGNVGFNKRPIRMLLQTDEEVGSRTSEKRTVKFMCEKAKDAIAFINLEGSSEGYACVRRRGIAYFDFKVKGVSAHASRAASYGASAILEAAKKIEAIEKYKDEDGISFNVGLIKGGTVPNAVPAECTFTVDARFKSAEELEKIKLIMREIAEKSYNPMCKTELKIKGTRLAMELSERNLALLDTANRIFKENGFSELKAGKGTGGSDAADITAFGIPCLDSLSATGGAVHSHGEFGNIESLKEASKRLAVLIYCI
jgi:glutamate carboxypeptidase